MKLRIAQIADIRVALNTLGKQTLPIAYELAKNSRICDIILKESDEILKELQKKYFDKDENGNLKNYSEEGKQIIKISDPALLKLFNVEFAKFDADLHEVTFVTISPNKLENQAIEANTLLPLIDTVIVD